MQIKQSLLKLIYLSMKTSLKMQMIKIHGGLKGQLEIVNQNVLGGIIAFYLYLWLYSLSFIYVFFHLKMHNLLFCASTI